VIILADGFNQYGQQGEAKPWTCNFENAPQGMSFQPFKIQSMDWAGYPPPAESMCEIVENPDVKILKWMQDWCELVLKSHESPRFTITDTRKGVVLTFTKAPMVKLYFRSRRLAKVYAKKHDITFEIGTK
jgi:hypothetical protein